MNDRPELPERASSATALVEVAQLDLRYEGCRLKSPAAEALLLAAIAAGGIQEALQGVETGGVRILLNGFKRLRCAKKLHLATVPFVALAADETAGIVCLLRAANDQALSLREQARFLDELKGTGGLSVAEIAQQVRRSPAWVSLRLGVLAELSPRVRGALLDGAFPVYSYLYTLRPFRRLNGAAAVDEFVAALRGKKLSARQIERLAHGFFRGPESLREQICQGHLSLPLQQLKAGEERSFLTVETNFIPGRTFANLVSTAGTVGRPIRLRRRRRQLLRSARHRSGRGPSAALPPAGRPLSGSSPGH